MKISTGEALIIFICNSFQYGAAVGNVRCFATFDGSYLHDRDIQDLWGLISCVAWEINKAVYYFVYGGVRITVKWNVVVVSKTRRRISFEPR